MPWRFTNMPILQQLGMSKPLKHRELFIEKNMLWAGVLFWSGFVSFCLFIYFLMLYVGESFGIVLVEWCWFGFRCLFCLFSVLLNANRLGRKKTIRRRLVRKVPSWCCCLFFLHGRRILYLALDKHFLCDSNGFFSCHFLPKWQAS